MVDEVFEDFVDSAADVMEGEGVIFCAEVVVAGKVLVVCGELVITGGVDDTVAPVVLDLFTDVVDTADKVTA